MRWISIQIGINFCLIRYSDPKNLPLGERVNVAFMGTLVRNGHGHAIVFSTAKLTEFGVIFSMMSEVEVRRTPLQESMDGLAKQLSIISFVVIAVIVLVGLIQKREAVEMITIGVSLAVAAIPEGLPIVVTVTLALGVLRMAKRNCIVKRLPSVEGLGSVSVVCADKTGTLTMNKMTASKIWTVGLRAVVDIEDVEVAAISRFGGVGDALREVAGKPSVKMLLRVGNLCNNSNLDGHGSPTEVALLELVQRVGGVDEREVVKRINEVPFNNERRYMEVRCEENGGGVIYVKGSMEAIMARCGRVYISEGDTARVLTPVLRQEIIETADRVAKDGGGLRVLGMAVGSCEGDMALVGFVAMADPIRRGVPQAVRKLMGGGVRVVMITGDSIGTAVSVAGRLGIHATSVSGIEGMVREGREERSLTPMNSYDGEDDDPGVMSGSQLEALTDRQLSDVIERVSVFYRTTPKHKMTIIKAFQELGHIVAMTGDGVNDAPALRMADIGISMGKGGTDVSKEAADMILGK